MKILILLLSLVLFSCGESPLFNHRTESGNVISRPELSESDSFSFSKAEFSFLISWQEGPSIGASRFILRSWNKRIGTLNGPYQDLPKTLFVYLWMPSMGHGSAPVKLKKIADGEYEISEVHFIMGGRWDVKFQLKDGSQVFDETSVPVSL